jgi:hypothetical protein
MGALTASKDVMTLASPARKSRWLIHMTVLSCAFAAWGKAKKPMKTRKRPRQIVTLVCFIPTSLCLYCLPLAVLPTKDDGSISQNLGTHHRQYKIYNPLHLNDKVHVSFNFSNQRKTV